MSVVGNEPARLQLDAWCDELAIGSSSCTEARVQRVGPAIKESKQQMLLWVLRASSGSRALDTGPQCNTSSLEHRYPVQSGG